MPQVPSTPIADAEDRPAGAPRSANRLIHETSPYLRQHAHNPVDWYPWGDEALSRARVEDRPILLSIGYAACHWCHVMERESFEDPETARMMNESFVCIKVDREERPDLDALYMQATQMLTGRGGWPMTVFLTPEGAPFFAGTYFPPDSRYGMPGFRQVLSGMAEAWKKRREAVDRSAESLSRSLELAGVETSEPGLLVPAVVDAAVARLARRFDPHDGGFGGAPKFPQVMTLSLLLRHHRRTGSPESRRMVTFTLERMARGGIYDQLGGGFARYSVDAEWLVPHFEKMLYDNALLGGALVEAWQVTHDDAFRRIACETLDYVLRDMTAPEGAFHATEDADSEGEEGRFYTWTRQGLDEALGDADIAALVADGFGVTAHGNFEHGTSILHRPHDLAEVAVRHGLTDAEAEERLAAARARLLEVRSRRVRPARDEKIITAWNGFMLDTMARAATAFGRDDYADAARCCAAFLLDHAWVSEPGGMRLFRVHAGGASRLNGYLEDYAALALGLLSLHEATLEPRWFAEARRMVDRMLELFWDEHEEAFFFTSVDHERLITRVRDPYDNATPSGNSLAVTALLRLAAFTGDERYRRPAEQVLRGFRQPMEEAPGGFAQLLCALELFLEGATEVVVMAPSAEEGRALHAAAFQDFVPGRIVTGAFGAERLPLPLLEGREMRDGRATAYVCRGSTCLPPVTDAAELRALLCAQA